MPNEDFTQVGYIAISPSGEWKIQYLSYTTGEPSLQEARGTQLAALVSGVEKNKNKYIEVNK